MTGLRLSRLRAGRYADFNKGVVVQQLDDGYWELTIDGSWVTTRATKAECVAKARRVLGETA